jgi:hypothetical protein
VAQEEDEEEEEDTPHIDTWRNTNAWVDFFMVCINDKIRDIRERNVTIRSDI